MTSGIFISYRRSDSKSDARSICQRLERTFGKGKVFIDVDSIRPGKNFQSVLKHDLEKCAGMVVVIGPRWLELLKSSGPADSETGHDYVRLEVASALERKLPVFPVLVDGAAMPDCADAGMKAAADGKICASHCQADSQVDVDGITPVPPIAPQPALSISIAAPVLPHSAAASPLLARGAASGK